MYATFTEQSIGEPIQLALDFSAHPPDHRTQVLEVSLSNRFCFLAFQNVKKENYKAARKIYKVTNKSIVP